MQNLNRDYMMKRKALLPDGSRRAHAGAVIGRTVGGIMTLQFRQLRPRPTGLPWEYCAIAYVKTRARTCCEGKLFVLTSSNSFLNGERLNKTLKLRILYKDKSGTLNMMRIIKRRTGRRSARYRRFDDDFVDKGRRFRRKNS